MVNLRGLAKAAICAGAAVCAGAANAYTFVDNFNPPSTAWRNDGTWTASAGEYYSTKPNNDPGEVTTLGVLASDVNTSVTVTINNLGDGGIVFVAPGNSNSVLFIVGGLGYGQGNRGGNIGAAAYWADAGDGSATYNEAAPVFTPGDTYTITVTDIAGDFSAYSGSTLLTSFDYPSLTTFDVGLYDDQPNVTTGRGYGPAQSFSDFSLTSNTVPEPAAWAMMLVGIGAVGAFLRGTRRGLRASA